MAKRTTRSDALTGAELDKAVLRKCTETLLKSAPEFEKLGVEPFLVALAFGQAAIELFAEERTCPRKDAEVALLSLVRTFDSLRPEKPPALN